MMRGNKTSRGGDKKNTGITDKKRYNKRQEE